jgi:hypothetical protein
MLKNWPSRSNDHWRAGIVVREGAARGVYYPATIAAAQPAVELAQTLQGELKRSERWWGRHWCSRVAIPARAHLERALALAQPAALRDIAADTLQPQSARL